MGQPTRTQAVSTLEHEVGVLIRRVRRKLAEAAKEIDPSLTAASFQILNALADFGQHRSSELVEMFSIDKGAISRQVQQLGDLGLVDRTPDPVDGRASLLRLTDEGRRRLDAVNAARRGVLGEHVSDWADADLLQFAAAMTRYNQSFS